jgi:molybdopterin-containing oxidoreductase family membrane subunit
MAVIAGIIGPVFILLCIGRLDRLHHLLLYPRLQSPIVWDVLAVITFLAGGILLLYLNSLPDFGMLRDSELKLGAKRKWYKRLALGFNNTPEQNNRISHSSDTLALLLIPVSIIVSSILSWIFGMTLRPGWNSTIFGPYFVLASMFSGTAMIILLMWIFRKIYHLERVITRIHFYKLGMLLIALGAGYGYFTFSEYFTEWYTSEKWNEELIHKLFNFNEYGAWTFAANFGGIILPLLLIGVPRFRKVSTIVASSVIVLCALYIKRYLIVIPTLETTLLPIQDSRPEYITYTATWVEWSLTFGGLAFFCLMLTLIVRFIPIVPVWESKKEMKKSSILSIKPANKPVQA